MIIILFLPAIADVTLPNLRLASIGPDSHGSLYSVGNQDMNCTLLEYMQHRRASVLFVQKYQAGGE